MIFESRVAIAGLIATILMILGAGCDRLPRARGPLHQDAYLWQRDWNSNVLTALATRGPHFRQIVILGAEAVWKSGQLRIDRIPFRVAGLNSGRVGLAMRVGPYSGPFHRDDPVVRELSATARSLVQEARRQGVEPVEFQLDFDCAESRLDGYRLWVETIRRELAPVPLAITALPSWLKSEAFASLASASGSFVLQVHSVARPENRSEPFELCDPQVALRQVEVAGRIGIPFRVALPSYGYLVAFGQDGHFLGASAEGPPPERPVGSVLREISANPVAMARLVRTLSGDRPATMQGLIWYRLPVSGDRLNWRWQTYEWVMAGREPEPRLVAGSRVSQPGLVEVNLTNEGSADRRGPIGIRGRWRTGKVVGSDAIRGFSIEPSGLGEILFTNAICRLPAGERIPIGWVRFEGEVPIEFEVSLPAGQPP